MVSNMRFCAVLGGLLLASPALSTLRADDPGRLGIEITAGSTSSVGARLRLGQRWLVRPTVTYWRQTVDNVPTITSVDEEPPIFETTDQLFGVGLGLGREVVVRERLRMSLGVTGSVGRNDASYPDIDADDRIVYRNDPLTRWSVTVAGGCEYVAHQRLGIFGEVGIGYRHGERFAAGGYRLADSTWSTLATGIGVAFYLR